jgi:hypothetical protein
MLERKTTGVAVAVVGSTLTSHGGESKEGRGLLADLVEEFGLAETKKRTRKLWQKANIFEWLRLTG